MTDDTGIPAEKRIDQSLTQLGRLTDAVKAEFDLITARIGWFMTSQAFVTAAFVVTLANADAIGRDHAPTLVLLKYALPIIGVIASYLVHVAVAAAHRATVRLKRDRDARIEALPDRLRITLISSSDRIHQEGNLPARVLPTIVGAFWTVALLSLLPWPSSPFLAAADGRPQGAADRAAPDASRARFSAPPAAPDAPTTRGTTR